MRFYITVSMFALSASVLSAPTPQVGAGSITNIGSGNGNHNGNKLIGDNALLSGNVLALDGVTDGILKEKRQDGVVDGLTGVLSDVPKVRVVGNARRQLRAPLVPGTTETVDKVTGELNTGGAVQGLNTDIHHKRQLAGDLSGLSAVTDVAGLVTKPVDSVTNGINAFDDKKAKRDIPIVSGLPVVGGLTDPLNHTPVVEGALSVVDGVVPDTSSVDDTLFSAVKPVTDATNVLDVKREADVVDDTLTAVLAGDGSKSNVGSFNGNGNGNSGIGHNPVLSGNGIVAKRDADGVDGALTAIVAGDGSKSNVGSFNGNGNGNSLISENSLLSGNGIVL